MLSPQLDQLEPPGSGTARSAADQAICGRRPLKGSFGRCKGSEGQCYGTVIADEAEVKPPDVLQFAGFRDRPGSGKKIGFYAGKPTQTPTRAEILEML